MDEDTKTSEAAINWEQQANEYLNNWKRERADFINYKRDEIKRLAEFVKYANEAVILDLIAVLDDLAIATKHNQDKGMISVYNKFLDLLKKYGVEKINENGKFDPAIHEAVEGVGGERIETIRAGYKLHGKLIRPAKVKILNN